MYGFFGAFKWLTAMQYHTIDVNEDTYIITIGFRHFSYIYQFKKKSSNQMRVYIERAFSKRGCVEINFYKQLMSEITLFLTL